MKYWYYLKAILYTIAGVLILVFNELIMKNVGIVVGSVVFLYGLNITIVSILKKRFFGENALVFDGIMLYLISLILFLVEDIISVCLVWAVWSIMREGKEMSIAIREIIKKKSVELLNLIESVVIIAFSFIMVLNPNEEEAHFHVYILGIELLLEVIFPVIKLFVERKHKKHKEKKRKNRNFVMETFGTINDAIVHSEETETEEQEKTEKPSTSKKKSKKKTTKSKKK